MATKNPPVSGSAINPSSVRAHDYADGASAIRVYATENIPQNGIVYITGSQKRRASVALAKADAIAGLKGSLFIAPFPIQANSVGYVINRGFIFGVDTTGSSVGAPVFLSKNGLPLLQAGFTTETTLLCIGTVIKVAADTANEPTVWINLQTIPATPNNFRLGARNSDTAPTMVGFGPPGVMIPLSLANVDVTVTFPWSTVIADMVVYKKGAGGVGAAIALKNGADTITSIDLSTGVDKQVFRPTSWDYTKNIFQAGEALTIDMSGTDPDCEIVLFATHMPF